ncbi:hypothetical protein B4080_3727 [Bacillus cereus]|nr:hypothetical protein B4080_3727 [Bacillus cereus]
MITEGKHKFMLAFLGIKMNIDVNIHTVKKLIRNSLNID